MFRTMFNKLKSWWKDRFSDDLPPPPEFRMTPPPSVRPANMRQTSDLDDVELESTLAGTIEDAGPGKNVLIRKKFLREDTGTHETLKILDDSLVDSGEESGIDPYNTGGFDRSKNWNNRFRS